MISALEWLITTTGKCRTGGLKSAILSGGNTKEKGFGTEAVHALIQYCTDELATHRIEALIHPENTASTRLVERLGFRCEGGPLTDYWYVGDKYLSVMVYALISCNR